MPITKSAIKALRQSQKKRMQNLKTKRSLKDAVKKTKTVRELAKAQSAIDKASKKKYIHKNKAARLKSRLAKRLSKSKSK